VRFKFLTEEKMSIVTFWVVRLYGLTGGKASNVSEKHPASIFRAKNEPPTSSHGMTT
jgi:hypothetical protein